MAKYISRPVFCFSREENERTSGYNSRYVSYTSSRGVLSSYGTARAYRLHEGEPRAHTRGEGMPRLTIAAEYAIRKSPGHSVMLRPASPCRCTWQQPRASNAARRIECAYIRTYTRLHSRSQFVAYLFLLIVTISHRVSHLLR